MQNNELVDSMEVELSQKTENFQYDEFEKLNKKQEDLEQKMLKQEYQIDNLTKLIQSQQERNEKILELIFQKISSK